MEKQSVSTIVRKPWGGQLEADQEPLPEPRDRDAFDWMLLLLRKLAELSFLSTLIAVPLMYHFSFNAEKLNAVQEYFGQTYFYLEQIRPWIGGAMPTLESKFTAWFVLGILMVAAHAAMRIAGGIGKRSPHGMASDSDSSRRSVHRLIPLLCISGFLIYSFLSFLLWPPAVPADAAITPQGAGSGLAAGVAKRLGGGGFFYSTTSWLQVVFALIFFLVAEDIIRERRFAAKIFGLIVLVGLVNAIVVVLQKVEFGPLMDIWVKFGESDARNRLGAFIGHNTGVASYLITPLLVALAWAVSIQPRKSQILRVALAISVLFMALAMLLTQSRAVVPIAILMAVTLFVMLIKRSALLSKSRLYIWFPVALFFVILTQLVPMRYNPLYRHDVTLPERIGEFRPERLLTETRLRILVVSASELIPSSPLLGHGFGTFQYVYPPAQGRYFENNPNSVLAPTPLRTQRAHNEYLQVLVETGIIGLGIALCGLLFLLRGGWQVMRRTLMPHHIAMQAAIICSLVGLLLHSFADFPLRVPPLSLTVIVLLAVWSAGDRLWLFPMLPPIAEDDAPIPSPGEERRPSKPILLAAVSAGILAALLAGAAALFSVSANQFLSAATMVNRGNQFLALYMETQNPRALQEGFQEVYTARRIYWISGPISRLNAQGRYLQARLNYQAADEHADEGKMETAVKARAFAETLATAGVSDINMAFSEENFDRLYVLRSQLNELIARNSIGERREEYFRAYRDDLEKAAAMNPGNVYTILQYIEMLENNPVLNRAKIVAQLEKLHHFHPGFFEERLFGRVLDAMSLGAGQDAYLKMQMIAEAVPEKPLYQQVLAATALAAGDYGRAREMARSILENAGTENRMARQEAVLLLVQTSILEGSYQSALETLNSLDRYEYVEPGYTRTIRLNLLEKTGARKEEVDRVRADLNALGREDPNQFRTAAFVAFNLFHDYEQTVSWLERRREARQAALARNDPKPPPEMDLQGYVLLAKSYAALGQWENIRERGLLAKLREKGLTPYSRELAFGIAREIADEARQAGADLETRPNSQDEDTP